MNTKFLAGLAMLAVLLAGSPVYAHGGRDGGGGSTSFAVARGSGGRSFASVRGGGSRGGSFVSHPGFAFGGSAHYYGGRGGGRYGYGRGGYGYRRGYGGYGGSGGYAFGYYGNPYYTYDYPDYGYDYSEPSYPAYGSSGYDNGGSVDVQVQQALAQQGYYRGAVDGIVGPATSAAISAYQHDNGLRVTGSINGGLLQSLGLE